MGALHARFLKRMRDRLGDLGWTQVELARRMGVTESHISRLLAGKSPPGLVTIEKVAKALRIPPEKLVGPC